MKKYSEQRIAFAKWIKDTEFYKLPEFINCVTAFRNWYKEILNAFKYGYTNDLLKVIIIRLKFLSEYHMVFETLKDSEIEYYIYVDDFSQTVDFGPISSGLLKLPINMLF